MEQTAISRKQLEALLKRFMTENGALYSLQKLGFFGSYARNQATAESDVDIVFATDKPDLFKTSMMKQDLEAVLGRKVDVIRLHPYLQPGFREQLEREAIYV